jgi:hypothetical protein
MIPALGCRYRSHVRLVGTLSLPMRSSLGTKPSRLCTCRVPLHLGISRKERIPPRHPKPPTHVNLAT